MSAFVQRRPAMRGRGDAGGGGGVVRGEDRAKGVTDGRTKGRTGKMFKG